MAISRGPRSIRLGSDLERLLDAAARRAGVTAAELIRDAIGRRCREVLGESPTDEWADVIGAFSSGGAAPHAREVMTNFGAYLVEKHDPARRRDLR